MPPASRSIMDARRSGTTAGCSLVGTDQGVALWDLARGTELTFLPIGHAWHLTFEPSGDLLTSGSLGVWRWPVQLGTDRNEYPHRSAATAPVCRAVAVEIAHDRAGKIVALANHSEVRVMTPESAIPGGAARRLPRRRRQPGRGMVGDRQSSSGRRQGLAHPRCRGGGQAAHRWG